MSILDDLLSQTNDDFEYGGAAYSLNELSILENKVDEARRMVVALGGEMRRRSEGSMPVWQKGDCASANVVVRTASAGV